MYMAKASKDMIISDLLALDSGRGISDILLSNGMHCLGCPSARGETLEQAAAVHGMDADVMLEEINNYLQGQKIM